jgi:hypothetical protein
MSVWEQIFDVLNNNGVEVYPPSIKSGECLNKYVVVKQDGSAQINNYSSQVVYYQFMLYVPKNQYNILSDFEEEVKKILNENLYPMIMPTEGNMTDYFDDEVKAHMRSFLYRNNVRNKYL